MVSRKLPLHLRCRKKLDRKAQPTPPQEVTHHDRSSPDPAPGSRRAPSLQILNRSCQEHQREPTYTKDTTAEQQRSGTSCVQGEQSQLTLIRSVRDVFPFMRLPLEIREMVYEQATKIDGFSGPHGGFSWEPVPTWYGGDVRLHEAPTGETSVSFKFRLVSRQVRHELEDYFKRKISCWVRSGDVIKSSNGQERSMFRINTESRQYRRTCVLRVVKTCDDCSGDPWQALADLLRSSPWGEARQTFAQAVQQVNTITQKTKVQIYVDSMHTYPKLYLR